MACEEARECGFRKVGGIYLVSGTLWAECDRLPFPVGHCPTCHAGVKFPRSPSEVNPLTLFGEHKPCTEGEEANPMMKAIFGPQTKMKSSCRCCYPTDEVAFLLGVGKKFYKTTQVFTEEARRLGVSKRIPAIPNNFEVGKTWIYLVHKEALFTQENVAQMGIFAAFRPERIEMPVWESELTEEKRKALEKRGITPVPFKDGDKDHMPRKAAGKPSEEPVGNG